MKKNTRYLLPMLATLATLGSIMMLALAPVYASSHDDEHDEGMSETQEMSKTQEMSETKKKKKKMKKKSHKKKMSDTKKKRAKRVNINSASVQELAKLSGIGPKKAAAIVKYRADNGPFTKLKDLLKVKGIGPSILAKNKGKLSVAKAKAKAKK